MVKTIDRPMVAPQTKQDTEKVFREAMSNAYRNRMQGLTLPEEKSASTPHITNSFNTTIVNNVTNHYNISITINNFMQEATQKMPMLLALAIAGGGIYLMYQIYAGNIDIMTQLYKTDLGRLLRYAR